MLQGLPCGSAGKESFCNAVDLGLIPGLGRCPGEGKGYPLQYSDLENSMDCIVHGVAESDTTERLSLSLFPGGSDGKESACSVEDSGLIPGLGSFPGEGHSNPLQYSCLENPHGQMSLAGYNPWGCKELGMTEQLSPSTGYIAVNWSHRHDIKFSSTC